MESDRMNMAEKLKKPAERKDGDAKESLAALADSLIAQIAVWKLEHCGDDAESEE